MSNCCMLVACMSHVGVLEMMLPCLPQHSLFCMEISKGLPLEHIISLGIWEGWPITS